MNRKPIGQVRGVVFVILMSIITLGVYLAYWTYRSFDEVNAHRGQGLGGGVVLLAALGIAILDVVAVASTPSVIDPWEPVLLSLILLILIVAFLLPSYIGRMYKEEGLRPAITGWSGFWWLVPYFGTFIWLAKNQGALNRFWEGKMRMDVATGRPPATQTT